MRRPLAKRVLDITAAGLLLVLLSPVALAVLIAFALDAASVPRDRGSLIYREPRISHGRTFALLKVRTLRADVLARAAGHARLLEADAGNLTWLGGSTSMQNPLDFHLERALSQNDVPHRFIASGDWQLPFGRKPSNF